MTCHTCKLNFPREDIDHDGVDCWRCFDAKQDYSRVPDARDPLASQFRSALKLGGGHGKQERKMMSRGRRR